MESLAKSAWGDNHQRDAIARRQFADAGPLHELDHPLLRQASRVGSVEFDDGPTLKWSNRIQLVTDAGLVSPWFKVRSDQLRGGLTDPSNDGAYWLVATGTRREGDVSNFYDVLGRLKKDGLEALYPTSEDLELLRIEDASKKLKAQKGVILESVIERLSRLDLDERDLPFVAEISVGNGAEMTLRLEVTRLDDDDEPLEFQEAEVNITVSMKGWADTQKRFMTLQLVAGLFESDFEKWYPTSTADGLSLIYLVSISEARLRQLAISARIPGDRSQLKPVAGIRVSHGHYTDKAGILDATVAGLATLALCGIWFVPNQSPDGKPLCPACQEAYSRLPQG